MSNQLSFQQVGSGQPLVILHGFTGSAEAMLPLAKCLSEERTIYLIDLPGHGQTGLLDDLSLHGFEETVRLLKDLLTHLDLEEVDLLGYSMGGRLALGFAVTYPETVNKLILVSSSPGLSDPNERRSRQRSDDDLADQIIEDGVENFVDSWMQQPLFASQQRLDPAILEEQRQQRLTNDAEGLAASLRGAGTGVQPSLWQSLDLVVADALLVVGEEDSKFRRIAMKMSAKFKESSISVIPDAGHAVHLENLPALNDAICSFLVEHQ